MPKKNKNKTVSLIVWGVFSFFIGVLLYQFTVLPMVYKADLDFSDKKECTTTFCGGGTMEGLKTAEGGLQGTGVSTEKNVVLVIMGWINFALPFAGLLAFAGIVYAGFLYVANFGDDEMTGKAKTIIFYALAGIVLIFSAYAIVSTIIRATS